MTAATTTTTTTATARTRLMSGRGHGAGDESNHRTPDYRPSALRLPFLAGLLVTVLALTGAMVYALCTFPVNRVELDFVSKRDIPLFPRAAAQSIPLDHSTTSISDMRPTETGMEPTQFPAETKRGDIGSNTVTFIPGPESTSTANSPPPPSPPAYPPTSNYGEPGWGTVTFTGSSTTVTFTMSGEYPSTSPSNFAEIGDNTVTSFVPPPITPTPRPSLPSSNYADVGRNTVTVGAGPGLTTQPLQTGSPTAGDPGTDLYVTPGPTKIVQGEWKVIGTNTETGSVGMTGIGDNPNPLASSNGNEGSHVSSRQSQVTLTDPQGRPTATIMVTSSPGETPTSPGSNDPLEGTTAMLTTTLTNSQGDPTATLGFFPSSTGKYEGNLSAPLPTNVDNTRPDTVKPIVKVYHISRGQYLVGLCLPTLLATVLVSIPIRLIDANARAMRPWRQLASASSSPGGGKRGVPAKHSLLMSTRPGMTTVSGFYALADAVGWGIVGVGTWVFRSVWVFMSPRSWSPSSSTSSLRGQHKPLASSSHSSEDQDQPREQYSLPVTTIVEPLSALTSLLYLAASLLIPFSGEAINLDLRGVGKGGSCGGEGSGNSDGCAFVLSVFERAAIPTLVLLAFIAVGLLVLLGATAVTAVHTREGRRQGSGGEGIGSWMRTGIATNPWSVCGVAALSLNPQVRRLFAEARRKEMEDRGDREVGSEEETLKKCLEGKRFGLGYFHTDLGKLEYGIVLCGDSDDDGDSHSENGDIVLHGKYGYGQIRKDVTGMKMAGESRKHRGNKATVQTASPESYSVDHNTDVDPLSHSGQRIQTLTRATARTRKVPFVMLGYPGRIGLLVVILGILTILVYYYGFSSGQTPFENFMNHESFGVRFLFTLAGVIISYLWESFSTCLSLLTPFRNLHHEPQPARTSILLAPPTNAYSGIWSLVVRQRHRGVNRSKKAPATMTPNIKDGWRNTNTFPALAAFLSICAEILLPISLSLVPFTPTTTFRAFKFGIYTSMLLLSGMAAMMLWSLIAWPCYRSSWTRINLPVNPVTIAGAMWYVLHDDGGGEEVRGSERARRSRLLGRLEEEGPLVATLGPEERDARVKAWEALYRYGEVDGDSTGRNMEGARGRGRIGIDITEETMSI